MKSIYGLLIKVNREKQGLKQEFLCRGICAVSYLSKIEKGLIMPSEEIIRLLFEKLGIAWYEDEDFLKKGKLELEELYKMRYLGVPRDKEKVENINKSKDKYLNSPLYLDYRLFELMERLWELKDIRILDLKEYMEPDQLYKAYYITGMVKKDMDMLWEARKIKYAPEVLYGMGNIKWREGKYYEAIELFLEALNLAYIEGYIELQMDICLILGHIYMDFHLPTMQKYYDKVLMLSKLMEHNSMDYYVYYHMGIAHTSKDFIKAEENLLKAAGTCPKEDHNMLEKTYQKLCFLYLKYDMKEKAGQFYEKAMEFNHLEEVNKLIGIMVCTQDYIHSREYIKQLAGIYNRSRKHHKFSNTKYYGDFLIEAYKANRKYKEALAVAEYIYAFLTQEN